MFVGARIDQLGVDSHLQAGTPHAAFENGSNAKGFANFPQITFLILVLHDRGAGNHLEGFNFG